MSRQAPEQGEQDVGLKAAPGSSPAISYHRQDIAVWVHCHIDGNHRHLRSTMIRLAQYKPYRLFLMMILGMKSLEIAEAVTHTEQMQYYTWPIQRTKDSLPNAVKSRLGSHDEEYCFPASA